MKKLLLAGIAAAGLAFAAPSAHAAFSYTNGSFIANPTPPIDITFTFLGKSASDIDLMFSTSQGTLNIFNNTTAVGTAVTLSNISANPFVLLLRDNATGTTWSSDPTANAGGEQHLAYTSVWTDFNLGATPPITFGTYYGWEDRPFGAPDRDYNDLVFAITIRPSVVPEPATIALFGAGLVGMGIAARRRRKVLNTFRPSVGIPYRRRRQRRRLCFCTAPFTPTCRIL